MKKYKCICKRTDSTHSTTCRHYNWGITPPAPRPTPTYYKIWKYLTDHGLTKGQAHYVRNMIRELKGF